MACWPADLWVMNDAIHGPKQTKKWRNTRTRSLLYFTYTKNNKTLYIHIQSYIYMCVCVFNYVHIITKFLALILLLIDIGIHECWCINIVAECRLYIGHYRHFIPILIRPSQHRPYVQSRVDPSISSWKNSNAGQLLVRRSSWCLFFRVRKVQQHGKLLLKTTYVYLCGNGKPDKKRSPEKSPFLWSINHLQIFGVLYIGFPTQRKSQPHYIQNPEL